MFKFYGKGVVTFLEFLKSECGTVPSIRSEGAACGIQSVGTAVTSVTYKRTTARYMVTELRLCHMLSVNNETRRDTKCVHTSA